MALRSGGETISARGVIFATVLMAVTLPGILITVLVSEQLREAALESRLKRLRAAAAPIAAKLTGDNSPNANVRTADGSQVAVQARAVDGSVRSSDPELFRRLETEFEVEPADTTGVAGLDIYAPRGSATAVRTEQVCYWATPLDAPTGWLSVTAVQSAPNLVRILDLDLLAPLFALFFGLQIVGAGLAEAMASFVERQFKAVLAPARKPVVDGTMPDLNPAALSELNDVVKLVNGHAQRVNELTASVEAARIRKLESEQRQRAELQQKLKTSLTAAAIAHEINLPLSNILLGSKMASDLLDDLGTTGDPLRSLLTGLTSESERVVKIIDRMRMLLRSVQTDLVPVDVTNVVVNALLQMDDVIRRHEAIVSRRGIDGPCMVVGDAVQLQIAVTNLLRNAVHAVVIRPVGGRLIDVAVIHPNDVDHAREMVDIVVGDSGPGMLEPLTIGEPLKTTKPDGSGIGLYVVRTIAENHGGTLLTERSPLGGAEVRLRLPAPAVPSSHTGAST
jgi:signal transduction histidine kinase